LFFMWVKASAVTLGFGASTAAGTDDCISCMCAHCRALCLVICLAGSRTKTPWLVPPPVLHADLVSELHLLSPVAHADPTRLPLQDTLHYALLLRRQPTAVSLLPACLFFAGCTTSCLPSSSSSSLQCWLGHPREMHQTSQPR
jgi:hypothetical protein